MTHWNIFLLAITKILRDTSGNVAIATAMLLLPIGVAAGVAVDYSRVLNEQRHLQEALDGAALASAIKTGTDEEKETAGKNSYFANFRNPCSSTPSFEFMTDEVKVIGNCEVATSLLGLVGHSSYPISAVARAGYKTSAGYRCLHALNASVSDALIYNNKRGPLLFTGNSIIAPDCDVQVNSSSSGALFIKEDEGYEFARHCIVGGVDGDVNQLTPIPDPNCKTPIPDPLSSRALPLKPTCLSNGVQVSGNTATIYPGNHCSGVSVSQDNIVLMPGVHHISGGDFQLQADASIIGNGITIVMHPGSNFIEIETEGVMDLKAPTAGDTAGFLVFDRNARAEEHLFKTDQNDTSSMALDGMIYAPEDHFELFWKRAGVGVNERPLYFKNFGIIADTIDLHGYNQVYIEVPDLTTVLPELATNSISGGSVRLLE